MAHLYHTGQGRMEEGTWPSLLGPPGAWSQILAKTTLFQAELPAPHLKHPESVSGEPLILLLSFPQNALEESTAEAPNPRPEDTQLSGLDQPLGHDIQFPPI